MSWDGAARDHGTFCVSCHTALPYALSRPVLQAGLSEPTSTIQEKKLLEDVRTRVELWNSDGPYYSDRDTERGKTVESRGTESVLNALILANSDARSGNMSPLTREAFQEMWSVRQTAGANKGSWEWLEFGHFEPWEADDSRYFGTALAALAVGTAPEDYRSDPAIQNNLASVRDYLHREYARQSKMNHVALLWASTKLPDLLTPDQKKGIIKEILAEQRADGGWRLATLSWTWRGWTAASMGRMWLRSDGTWIPLASDGYATGLIAYVLQEAGVDAENQQLKKALAWLDSNQEKHGFWASTSLNERRNPTAYTAKFMSDAATAYAALALEDSVHPSRTPQAALVNAGP